MCFTNSYSTHARLGNDIVDEATISQSEAAKKVRSVEYFDIR